MITTKFVIQNSQGLWLVKRLDIGHYWVVDKTLRTLFTKDQLVTQIKRLDPGEYDLTKIMTVY